MTDVNVEKTKHTKVERTYEWYLKETNSWGNACYYYLVTDAFKDAKKENPKVDFQEFDDDFLRQLAGMKPGEPLPLKSNEVFDETYWSHLVQWYYLPCNCEDSIYFSVLSFMEHVKAGNLEPFSDFYLKGYPFLTDRSSF